MCNSLIYLKSNGEKLNCYNYVNQAKNNRKDYIPIKYITKRTIHPTAIEIDIKTTIIILDEAVVSLDVGATFGESIVHDLPRDMTVCTKTTCELLRIHQNDFKKIWDVSDKFKKIINR
ncbi:hypothetical protein QTP88_004945 [Uroleucon formosanum]